MSNIIDINKGKKVETIPSYEVAKMMGKEHKEIMWMIEGNEKRGIVGIKPTIEISAELHLSDYFIKSSYKDSMNRKKSSYECTKMGCDGAKIELPKNIEWKALLRIEAKHI